MRESVSQEAFLSPTLWVGLRPLARLLELRGRYFVLGTRTMTQKILFWQYPFDQNVPTFLEFSQDVPDRRTSL